MKNDVVVHVGYHKTGSSWLQEELFPVLEDVAVPLDFGTILEAIVTPHPFVFDEAKFWDEYGATLRAAASKTNVTVLSSERLSGSPHSGGYDSRILTQRIQRLFPEAKILVVVREQMQMIASNYREYIRGGGTCSLKRYLNPPVANHRPMFDPDYFRYDKFVEQYYEAFGTDQVKVLPFEWLKARPKRFVSEVCGFLGAAYDFDDISFAPVRVGVSDTGTRMKRWTNKVTRRNSLHPCASLRIPGGDMAVQWALGRIDPLLRKIGREGGFIRQVREHLEGHYGASNKRLQQYMRADLGQLGYEIS